MHQYTACKVNRAIRLTFSFAANKTSVQYKILSLHRIWIVNPRSMVRSVSTSVNDRCFAHDLARTPPTSQTWLVMLLDAHMWLLLVRGMPVSTGGPQQRLLGSPLRVKGGGFTLRVTPFTGEGYGV
jgi:hypothetical protein